MKLNGDFGLYLKALEIQGFKSFPDKTRLTFEKNITAIVGPNGSGKSNISDAILWVMGEQRSKALRGSKMEDVIFGGTEKRGALGYAQVSLIIDNSGHIFDSDSSEIMLTRRYYRSGESEYSINREPCRLRDINELLMDTGLGRDGYSIIGQGRIAEIVSGKSNERREIFEEAAGISRYRYRKEESERKLARTEENLLRINDKVDELELQVEPLRKQAETAKKYLHLRDELKSAEVSVWMETLDRLHAQAETVNHDYQTAKENLAGAQRELEQLYAASENIAQKMREKDLESERTREQISEAESAAAECESAAAVVRTNLQNSADSIARLRVEVSEQADRASALQAQIDAQQQRLEQIEREKAQHAQQIDTVLEDIERNAASSGEAERAYTELLARESAQSSALAECRTRITLLADKSQELLDQENAIVTAAAEAAATGTPCPLDVGRHNDRYFAYVASFGAFTRSSYSATQAAKNALGHFAYILEGLGNLDTLRPYRCAVEADGERFEGEFIFGAVCNSTSLGGLVKLDPSRVRMDDGKFELLLLRMPKTALDLQNLITAMTRMQYDYPGVILRHVRRVTLTTEENLPWSLDGEYCPSAPRVEIENLPAAIQLVR